MPEVGIAFIPKYKRITDKRTVLETLTTRGTYGLRRDRREFLVPSLAVSNWVYVCGDTASFAVCPRFRPFL